MRVRDDDARALRAALAKLNRRLRGQDEPEGVGSTGLALLGRLVRDGPSTAATLASAERLQPQSLTRTLRTLEDRGLIARTIDAADRRRATIVATKAGLDLLASSLGSREAWLAAAMAELSPLEREVLRIAIPVLERLADVDLED